MVSPADAYSPEYMILLRLEKEVYIPYQNCWRSNEYFICSYSTFYIKFVLWCLCTNTKIQMFFYAFRVQGRPHNLDTKLRDSSIGNEIS